MTPLNPNTPLVKQPGPQPQYLSLRATNDNTTFAAPSTIWAPNTPATISETFRVSAPKLNQNFNTIGDGFGQEHNPLGSTVDIGQHIQSTYINQLTTPTADAANARLFGALVGAIPQLFIQYPTTVTPDPIQLTKIAQSTTYNNGAITVTEFSFILNSQTIKMGGILVTAIVTAQITFITPFSTNIPLFGCMPSGTANPQSYSISGISLAGFTINSAAPGTYFYIAIGQ